MLNGLYRNAVDAVIFLIAASLIQYLWPILAGTGSGRLTLRRCFLILFRSCLSFAAYLIMGASLSHIYHPSLSTADKESLPLPDTFYSDKTSSQRAALIYDNFEAMEMRLRMIANAKESVILSTFSIHGDDSGIDLCAALLNAAHRGVKVGILTDGYDAMTENEGKEPFMSLAAHPNIDFHVYSPCSVLRPGKAMARMHEKYLITDGELLLMGGRNCHDYFLGDYPAQMHNIDLDVLVCGSGTVIDELTSRYNDIINLPDTKPLIPYSDERTMASVYSELTSRFSSLQMLYPAAWKPYDYMEHTVPCNKISLIASSFEPTAKKPTLWHTLCSLMNNAQDKVVVHTPYLICSKAMKEDLANISEHTNLRITLNSPNTSANLFGSAVYLNDRSSLMATGAELWEYYGERSSHTKAICIDERLSIIGSFNLDMRSAYIDSEIMLAIDSPDLSQQLGRFMSEVEKTTVPAGSKAPMVSASSTVRNTFLFLLRLFERPFRHLL